MGGVFCLEKISGGIIMTKLKELYEEREKIEGRKVTGTAGSMHKLQKLRKLQKEIDYYELGDTISRAEIQKELAEIEVLQGEIDRLSEVVAERRRVLKQSIFGAYAGI